MIHHLIAMIDHRIEIYDQYHPDGHPGRITIRNVSESDCGIVLTIGNLLTMGDEWAPVDCPDCLNLHAAGTTIREIRLRMLAPAPKASAADVNLHVRANLEAMLRLGGSDTSPSPGTADSARVS